MGQRGPKKTPTAVKKARGTFRADRDAGVEITPGEPSMPGWLSNTARGLWRELAPQLVRENLLTPIDGLIFALLCDTWSTFQTCHAWIDGDPEKMFATAKTIDKEGEEHDGSVYQHPIVSIWHKSRNDLLRLSREFGLTPSSRSGMRIGSNEEADDDPLAKLSARFEQLVGARPN